MAYTEFKCGEPISSFDGWICRDRAFVNNCGALLAKNVVKEETQQQVYYQLIAAMLRESWCRSPIFLRSMSMFKLSLEGH